MACASPMLWLLEQAERAGDREERAGLGGGDFPVCGVQAHAPALQIAQLFDLDPRDVSLVSAPPTILGDDG